MKKTYKINHDAIKSIEDIVSIVKLMAISFSSYSENRDIEYRSHPLLVDIDTIPTDTKEGEVPTEEVKWDWIDKASVEFVNLNDKRLWYLVSKSFCEAIEKHKPVEQELIPLDVNKIAKEVSKYINKFYYRDEELDIKSISAILSKYLVHKQEEDKLYTINDVRNIEKIPTINPNIYTWWDKCELCNKHHNPIEHLQVTWKIPTPTPQAITTGTANLIIDKDNIHNTQATSVDVENIAHDLFFAIRQGEDYLVIKKDETIARFKSILSSLPIHKKRSREEIKRIKDDCSDTDFYEMKPLYIMNWILIRLWLLSD